MIEDYDAADVVGEVRQAFEGYNEALEAGDADAVNAFFWDSPLTVRFGYAEHLFGYDAISTFRSGVWKKAPPRTLEKLAVTALGRDIAVTNAMFRAANGTINRQTQVWARVPEGWRIASAHVSNFSE